MQQPHHIFVEEAAAIYGIKPPNFYARMKQSRAPQPVGKVGKRNVWDRAAVQTCAAANKRQVACTTDDLSLLRAFVDRLDETLDNRHGLGAMACDLSDAQHMLEEAIGILAEYPTSPVTEALVRAWRHVLEERAT